MCDFVIAAVAAAAVRLPSSTVVIKHNNSSFGFSLYIHTYDIYFVFFLLFLICAWVLYWWLCAVWARGQTHELSRSSAYQYSQVAMLSCVVMCVARAKASMINICSECMRWCYVCTILCYYCCEWRSLPLWFPLKKIRSGTALRDNKNRIEK